MGKVESVSKQILLVLLHDFQSRELPSEALDEGYVGPTLKEVERSCIEQDQTTTQVDVELALKELEDNGWIDTGPMMVHDSPPDSELQFIGLFSTREYVHLTIKGYRMAR
ncbi:MAG: hypothetical protein JWO13_453 [Acidobacteriales bacterium]|nr:hypothetical protein [Terriglobales bacterium]